MATAAPTAILTKLKATERRFCQILAVADENIKPGDLSKLYKSIDWLGRQTQAMTVAEVKRLTDALVKKQVLSRESYSSVAIRSQFQSVAVQTAIHDGTFEQLCKAIQTKYPRQDRFYSYGGDGRASRDMRIAFYNGDATAYQALAEDVDERDSPSCLLEPFDPIIYDRLDPILRELYLEDMLPKLILQGIGSVDAIAALEQLLGGPTKCSDELIAAAADMFFAAGQLDRLSEMDGQFGKAMPEIGGYLSLLQGDHTGARAAFAAAIPLGKKTSKKSKTATKSLCGVLYALLLLSKNTAEDRSLAATLISKIAKTRGGNYSTLMELFKSAISFQESPASPAAFANAIKLHCDGSLSRWVGGYLWTWNLAADDAPAALAGLTRASTDYAKLSLGWLAAELAGLAAMTPIKLADQLGEKSEQLHAKMRTKSLIDLAHPVPHWQQALAALRQLSGSERAAAGAVEVTAGQRMIWELDFRIKQSDVDVRPIIQKRSGGGWTKGRRVSLERLYHQRRDAEFAFLTEQDHSICNTLDCDTDRNYYGYNETSYFFDSHRLVRAIIGHPRLFREGERENPIEVAQQQPQLIVKRTAGDQIALSLEPTPTSDALEAGFQLVAESNDRLGVIFFTKEQLKLHAILNGSLTVPESAERLAMESIGPLASLISIHSEVDAGLAADQTVAADPSPHLHAVPYDAGMQLTFHVRPLGADGPFFTAGAGAETVVARIGNQTMATRRDLGAEQDLLSTVMADCPSISVQVGERKERMGSETIYLPTAEDSLQVLLELEDLVVRKKLTLHWPRGRKMQLAGQVSGADFRLNIKRDRDWFAASGELKVDKALSLDMMRLIELVEASPSRFVQLDDGRFLALTEQFRRHIEAMSAYGEHAKGKLRFPPIRAAAMEDMEETFSIKSDKHWKDCLQRIRQADEISPELPSTLSADLRDYQREGFTWLARLAHWGAGACLADDMGLGKTIQTLALLLHRVSSGSGGPALVVAPTSVAFNWKNEIQRFAPTLTAHLFGPGDRTETLHDLGPRDVVICSYGLLHSEAEKLQAQQWGTVVLDEAQAIKNVATRRSEAAMGLSADFRLIVTGTPMENHLGELWNLFQFINPGLLGSLDSFTHKFALPIERDGCAQTRRRLKKLIQPFVLRRTKTQVLEELPSRTEITLKVALGDVEAAMYEALRQQAVEKLADSDDVRPTHLKILAELMRLRRFCCHPRLVTPELELSGAKLSLFSETIDELLQGNHKVLVFSQFVDHLTVLREELDRKGVQYQYLDGGTPAGQRKTRVEAFQSGEGDVFLISLRAGGVGLNLTSADYVIHMDPWWNPAVEDQASDRAHRLGQTRPVTIYRFITEGTIEERILELHASKRDLADSLLEGTDRSGKLSTQELLKLIRN
jgi:hypothetical protein